MTNTNITRTINLATATVTVFNAETETLEKKEISIPTTQKVTEKEFKRLVLGTNETVLKVSDIHYTSALYEMPLSDFMLYGTKVGDGRKTL